MFDTCKSTKAQGNIGLGCAISYFTKSGYIVSIPLNDSQEYDLVVGKDSILYKIQVKTTKAKAPSGSYVAQMRNTGGTSGKVNSYEKDSNNDFLFILTELGTMYLIPKEEYKELKSSITLGDKYNKYIVL